MRAFVIKEHAHPSTISLVTDAKEPAPRKDQVIVDVYSAGLNFFDILQAQGKYQTQPKLPFVLGVEFAGKIAKDSPIPKGCRFKPGDRVFGGSLGAYADKVVVDHKTLLPLPVNMSFDQGASLYVTWPTSYEALVGRADLKPGEWVLVLAAAGGVGLVAVQIAKALGARVIAAAGSAEKLEVSKKYGGADHAIDYTKPDWQKEVMQITGGKGVDVVFDPVGLIRDSLKCIAFRGRAVVVGFAGGNIEKLPLNLVLLKNIAVTGLFWGSYAVRDPPHVPKVWQVVLELLSSGKITPVVYPGIQPLERIGDALVALESRKTWGKAVVRVKDEDRKASAKL